MIILWIYDTAFQVEAAAVFQSKVIINASARSGKVSLHTQENMVSDRSRKMWLSRDRMSVHLVWNLHKTNEHLIVGKGKSLFSLLLKYFP